MIAIEVHDIIEEESRTAISLSNEEEETSLQDQVDVAIDKSMERILDEGLDEEFSESDDVREEVEKETVKIVEGEENVDLGR